MNLTQSSNPNPVNLVMISLSSFIGAIDRFVLRTSLFIQSQPVLIMIGYFLVQAVALSLLVPGAGVDDGEQISYAGKFNIGYGGSQPPLYTWLVSGLTAAFDISMPLLFAIRYALLSVIFWAVYKTILEISGDKAAATAAMIGLFLLPTVGWEAQRVQTHTIAGTAGAALFMLSFCRHLNTRSLLSSLAMGGAAAISFLGKYNAMILVVAILTASVFAPHIRRRFFTKSLFIGLLAYLLLTGPHVFWMAGNISHVFARSYKFAPAAEGNWLQSAAHGISSLVANTVSFVAVILVITALAWIWHTKSKEAPVADKESAKLFAHATLIGLLIFAIGLLVSKSTNVQGRWLMPILFAVPATIALYVSAIGGRRLILDALICWGAVAAMIMAPALWANKVYGTVDTPSYAQYDFRSAEVLQQLSGAKALVSNVPHLIGNLKLGAKQVVTVHPEMPSTDEIKLRPLLVVWTGEDIPADLKQLLNDNKIQIDQQQAEIVKVANYYRADRPLTLNFITVH